MTKNPQAREFAAGRRMRSGWFTGAVLFAVLIFALLSGCDAWISPKNRALPFSPAEITLPASQGPLRVLVLGDFGSGSSGQMEVARAIQEHHRARPFHFGITVGDNFYMRGVASVRDSKWKSRWEDLYGGLGIPFYPTLGNHDYYGDVQAQLDYVSPSKTWHFPARQYVLRGEQVDLIAIDTMDPRTEQYHWLEEKLKSSTARWKIVYGHHPIYSAGGHGDNKILEQVLLPLLRGRVPLYIAGHDHDLQHFKPIDGMHQVISGGGGAKLRQLKPDPRTLFARTMYGFSTLEISPERIHLEMFDQKGLKVHEADIQPLPGPEAVAAFSGEKPRGLVAAP